MTQVFNLILSLLLSFLSLSMFAQNQAQGSISGILQSDNQEAIAYASISTFDSNQQFIAGTISDENGQFKLDGLPLTTLELKINYLGFQEFQQTIELSSSNKKIKLGTIALRPDKNLMDEVVISAEKSTYTQKLDKKIFNVGKDILAQNGSTSDVLNQVPQVSVTPDGAVSLRGNSAVQILINGRRSGLTMNNAIDQIAAENIAHIEVITNPSAAFNASGTAGIINIVLKKNTLKGWSGQLSLNGGFPANHIVMPSINYKNKKINLFANYRLRYSDYNGDYSLLQESKLPNDLSTLSKSERELRHDDGRSLYLGGDYYINDKNSITLAYYRSDIKDTDTTYLNYDFNQDIESRSFLRKGVSVERRNYNQLESNFTHQFKQNGHKWTMDLQYDFWNSTKDWTLQTSGDNEPLNIPSLLRTNTISGSQDFVIKTDYIKPLTEKSKLELGAQMETRTIDNDFVAEEEMDESWSIFRNYNFDIAYSERIAAAYAQYGTSIKKWNVQAGLRAEQTLIDIQDATSTYAEDYNYFNLFPSLFISRELNDHHSIQASYSRRIQRPSLWNLFPYREITDVNIIYLGNPNLRPAFTNGIDLSYMSVYDKWRFNPGVYVRSTNNVTTNYYSLNDDGIIAALPINIANRTELGTEFSLYYKPLKMTDFRGEFNYFYFNNMGSYNQESLDQTGSTWSFRVSNNLNLSNTTRVQTRFDYRGPNRTAQIQYFSSYDLSIGISQSFLDNRLSINVRGMNLLNSRYQRSLTDTPEYRIDENSTRIGRRYSVGLLYRINMKPRQRIRQENRQNR